MTSQPKTLDQIISAFGASTKLKLSNAGATGAPEDQLRNPFEALLADLSDLCRIKNVSAVGETTLSSLQIRPDFSVTVNEVLVGFVELKAPGKGADPRKFKDKHDKGQWEKLKQLPNLIYTDGNQFSLWRSGELVDNRIVQLIGDVGTSGAALGANFDLVTLFSSFFQWEPIPPRTVKELATMTAKLCHLLRDEVGEQLVLGSPIFKGYAKDWRNMLFPEATDEKFADGYAQAVTFGLLMARAQGVSLSKGFTPVIKALKGSGSLIGSAIQLLIDDTNQDSIKTSTVTLTRVLEVVNWPKLSKGNADAWLYFYEDFLEVYDNDLRKQTGSYYTPPEVVSTMVRWADSALRSSAYGLPAGLASPAVQLIDPATGTGTYLLGVLRHIAAHVRADQGEGAVAGAIHSALDRIAGFELQLGPYAVAQLRLLAEVVDMTGSKPKKTSRLFVTNTLSNPHDDGGQMAQMFAPIAESRKAANKIKREAPVTVIIGNPPYKEKAKGKGGWIETGDPSRQIAPPLDAWQPPAAWKVGAHTKHLRNLYVYFWRWASWKVWDHGPGDKTGIVCFITVAGFLNGPGFQMMRASLRATCDDIWVVDCSPEGHQPDAGNRIFQGVQQPICIVVASRSSGSPKTGLAHVRFRALSSGRREEKFKELASIELEGSGWSNAPSELRAPFLAESKGAWVTFPKLEDLFTYSGSGVMPGRTWVIASDSESLVRRWDKLVATPAGAEQEVLFQPHLVDGKPGDKHINKKASAPLPGFNGRLMPVSADQMECIPPVRYGFRSFDRQWIIPDVRLINRPNPTLWDVRSSRQVFITAPHDRTPTNGPALTVSGLIPDLHHYAGRGGRAFPLWSDAAATQPNVSSRLIELLSKKFGMPVSAEDLFAYIVGIAASPHYTKVFQEDLATPGLRIPITAEANLFVEAVSLGKQTTWLHTFGERMVDAKDGRAAGAPRAPAGYRPEMTKAGAIPPGMDLPDEIRHDDASQRLHVGVGFIDKVSKAVWNYEVSGKQVIVQWFSYRKRDRSKPVMGDKHAPSALQLIQPDCWLSEYTKDLIDLLNVLTLIVEMEVKQAALLEKVRNGSLISEAELLAEAVIVSATNINAACNLGATTQVALF